MTAGPRDGGPAIPTRDDIATALEDAALKDYHFIFIGRTLCPA